MSETGSSLIIMSKNPSNVHPHIYKKGKILEFKKLNEGVDLEPRNYIFSGVLGSNSLNTIVSSTNNLNRISRRCLLGIHNLLSFFGLSKDPSEKLSKSPSIYNRYYTFVKKGNDIEIEILRDIKKLLVKQNAKIEGLEAQISQLRNTKFDNEALDLKLKEIEEYLKKILG